MGVRGVLASRAPILKLLKISSNCLLETGQETNSVWKQEKEKEEEEDEEEVEEEEEAEEGEEEDLGYVMAGLKWTVLIPYCTLYVVEVIVPIPP